MTRLSVQVWKIRLCALLLLLLFFYSRWLISSCPKVFCYSFSFLTVFPGGPVFLLILELAGLRTQPHTYKNTIKGRDPHIPQPEPGRSSGSQQWLGSRLLGTGLPRPVLPSCGTTSGSHNSGYFNDESKPSSSTKLSSCPHHTVIPSVAVYCDFYCWF